MWDGLALAFPLEFEVGFEICDVRTAILGFFEEGQFAGDGGKVFEIGRVICGQVEDSVGFQNSCDPGKEVGGQEAIVAVFGFGPGVGAEQVHPANAIVGELVAKQFQIVGP